MKKVMASAGLLALGALGVQTAHAQLSGGSDKPWSLAATLRGFYDDNYNTQPDGPNRVDSFGFEVRPSAALDLALDQTTLKLSYTYSMKYYDDRPSNKADHSHDFEALVNHNFSPRYSLDASESFVIAQEPEVLDRTLSFPLRNNGNNIRNNGSINFHAQITELFGVVLGYANTFYDYQQSGPNSLSASLDRMEHLVTLNGRWQFEPETTGILGYQFGAVDHTSSDVLILNNTFPPIVAPASVRNNYSHYFYVGAEHKFRRDLSASARVGLQYTDYYNDPTTSSAVGPYADLSLSYNYIDTGTATFGFRHSRNQTDVTGGTTGTSTSFTQDQESSTLYGSIVQKLTPKMTGTLTGQYQNSVYNGGSVNGSADNFYLVGLNLAYQFMPNLSAELGYNYDLLKSGLPNRGYDRNRVYLGVTASY
ncbi:MAG: hypothetical protein JWR19_4140 [Pedosphaera sp.]|nr:hypothetical protein [Pedosphaera sp.]